MGLRALALLVLLAGPAAAQPAPAEAVRWWREANEHLVLGEFFDLLRLPNTGEDPAAMRRNAEAITRMLARRGVATRLLETTGAPPAVYGELPTPGARQTVVFYAHYDGQAARPEDWWTGGPFRPVLMSGPLESGGQPIPLPRPGWPSDPEWRLYARSAADDKAAIMAICAALEALRARDAPIRANLKFLFEGEEEKGSPNLERLLREHRRLLTADLWLVCDGPVHPSRAQQIIFGARGIAELEIAVWGPRRELHSGHYGNWAPNPVWLLARLLASLRDEQGNVAVDGFHEGIVPLSDSERQAVAEAPDFGLALKRELWLAETEGGNRRIEEAVNLPLLNIRGLASATVGSGARNVIPEVARASVDIRLVKGMNPRLTMDRVEEHIRRQGFHVMEGEPGEDVRLTYPRVCQVTRGAAYPAVRTSMDLDVSRCVVAAVESASGPAVKLPTLGGSLPLHAMDRVFGVPAIVVPIANHDSNQHGQNENLRLRNLWDGIEVMAALMAMEPPGGQTRR